MENAEFNNILDDFNFLESWEDKYRYIIDLGKNLEIYPEKFKCEEYRVLGCASQVWFLPKIIDKNGVKFFTFKGDSDAMIVRGLIKILSTIYNNKNIKDALEVDPYEKLDLLDLKDHISSQRTNGLNSMILKIKEIVSNT